jgi:hypothetical protein
MLQAERSPSSPDEVTEFPVGPNLKTVLLIIKVVSRTYAVLIKVYKTQKHWNSGFCPSSGILKTRKQRFGNSIGDLRLAFSKGPNRVCVFHHLKT